MPHGLRVNFENFGLGLCYYFVNYVVSTNIDENRASGTQMSLGNTRKNTTFSELISMNAVSRGPKNKKFNLWR